MVVGMDRFKEAFKGYEDCYTIIGGTACDILMSKTVFEFRVTRDIDMILLIENRFEEFGEVLFMWNELYNAAIKVQNNRMVSPFVEAGGVAAAILTKQGNIYVGVCIDTACTLGMCAERNAIANMITNGESQIDKVVAVMPDGKVGSPCGACREFMMQLDKNSGDIEILLDMETKKTVKLRQLVPDWWGYDRFGE